MNDEVKYIVTTYNLKNEPICEERESDVVSAVRTFQNLCSAAQDTIEELIKIKKTARYTVKIIQCGSNEVVNEKTFEC